MTDEPSAPPPRPHDGADVIGSIAATRIVPVVTIDDADDGPRTVAALVSGGLAVVEITLRTPAGLEAVRRAAAEVPAAVVGVGSVTDAAAATAAIDAGAQFIVSPGIDDGVIATARDRGVPAIPGIATATELMRALWHGVDVVKLFPAEVIGGADMIDALSAVWPEVRFMPTGGISPANLRSYLARPQVLAVGGSWIASKAAVARGDWTSITTAAAAALDLAREST
jgi:2-dehydro-3-deoxyphosphogluconate aldolase/(4S)-4-hydroxy-2-oxoglutarate aldolase